MSLEELKSVATSLNEEERVWLAAFLKHLSRRDSPEYKAELSRLNQRISDGHYATLEQAKKMHEALSAEGM